MKSPRINKDILFKISPILVIVLGHLTVRLCGSLLGVWVWLPLALVLWGMFALLIFWNGGWEKFKGWIGRPGGSIGWSILALSIGLIPLPLFLLNWRLFTAPWQVIIWMIFALVNAPLEEGYWRGVLTDATSKGPGWLGVLYSSFFFAANHPLTYGVYSQGNRHPVTFISTFVMGVAWAWVYRKTGSLRMPILAHILVDLFNLSILAFLNIYVPTGIPGR